jgi:hypothetical protein
MTTPISNKNNPIYKVNYLVNDKIKTILVFAGKFADETKKAELIKSAFNEKERKNIEKNKIEVKISNQEIHFDDSIGIIKLKILNEFKTTTSIEQIYLFCEKLESFNSVQIYKTLTQNKKLELTKLRFSQFLSNIVSLEDGKPFKYSLDKEIYDYDDILQMDLERNKYIVNKVLGQKFFIVENEYPFVCNPYENTMYDSFIDKNAKKTISTLNSHLLLNTGKIINDNIYLCLAEDVLTYAEKSNISQETTLKIYFPFLHNKNIDDLAMLKENEIKLRDNNDKILTTKVYDNFNTIDMFYNVYDMRKNDLNYVSNGIKYIKAEIKPEFDVKIPLEVIFKIVHATENNPLIKYNPSTRQENIYRLYTDKMATDGRKIPFLKKATIFKLVKNIARTKSVAVYIEKGDNSLICEFEENGFITIYSEFSTAISPNDINELFKETVNPIIDEIRNLLEQSGYKIMPFESLYAENVEIKQLTYETQIMIKNPINLEAYKGCVSSIFTNETSSYKEGIHLRFKRVANFNKVTSQEAFIIEKIENRYKPDEILDELEKNFPDDLTRNEASELIRKVVNELQVERGVKRTEIKIKDNPGFKTVITLEQKTGKITIVMENINDINYLQTVPIYLDTLIRLTQDKNSTKYPVAEINKLCGKVEKEDIKMDDIISLSERSVSSQQVPSIEDEELSYQKLSESIPSEEEEKMQNILDMFYGDEDEEEEDLAGGKPSSGSSISSDKSLSSIESEIPSPEKSLSSLESEVPSPKEETPSPEKSLSSLESEVPSPKEETPSPEKSLSSLESEIPSPKEEIKEETKEETPSQEETKEETKEETPSQEETPSPEKSLSSLESEIPSPEEEKEIIIEEPKKKPKVIIESESDEREKSEEEEGSKSEAEIEEEGAKSEAEIEEEGSKSEAETEEEETVRNIDNVRLKKPYYFQTKIEEKDPVLIIKEDTPEYNSYSRTCSSDTRRQPVILTDAELEKIRKDQKMFLRDEDVIKYGSNPKKQFNYVCPRYWCLKTNKPVDPNDIKEVTVNGKKELVTPNCGKVLPKNAKEIKPGYYVYEFYEPKKGDPDYKRYPGFQTDKHPDGYCLPCCFDKYLTEARVAAKNRCLGKPPDEDKGEEKMEKKEEMREDEYIKGPDKFPLQSGRWGFLPVPIQKMLHESNVDCQISKTNASVKTNHPCLLRHGVEVNDRQSFIACISDVLFYGKRLLDSEGHLTNNVAKILSIPEMKERIINAINIDEFIKYQNGNLVNDFHNTKIEVNINKYKDTKLYAKLDINKEEDLFYYKKVISAYENFIDFLNDNEAIIDHTYLWDIISKPNKYLFPQGVNLVIFKIPNDDVTNNVQLLCPTNHYSSQFYEARKPTIILVKQDNYYEPIYSYINDKKIIVTKEFKEYDPHLSKTISAVFKQIIKPFFEIICKPLDSMPGVYKAKRPLLLYNLVQKLDKYEYKILKVVLNFSNKVIGVVAEAPGNKMSGFIPCYPSAIDDNIKKNLELVFMTDETIWNTYENTVDFLTKLNKRSKLRKKSGEADIPCAPAFKVIEDELVVGIITETNQFVQLSEPIPEFDIKSDFDIPSLRNDNYIFNKDSRPMLQSDVKITTQTDVDTERVNFIHKIKSETKFYNVFRNTIRILLNDYENVKLREKIENEIAKDYIIYSEKLKNVIELLEELVQTKIQFIGDKNYYKMVESISSCIVKSDDKCREASNVCALSDNGTCNLILPERNLITEKKNKDIYFGRMADELIRYSRIKTFMFQPQVYLSFGNIGYNLRDNEIILIQSLLTQEYFEDITYATINKYVKYNSYDEAEPVITQTYDNKVKSLDQAIGIENEKICEKTIKDKITSGIWSKCFPSNYKEVSYGKTRHCTFTFMAELINKKTSEMMTSNQIKNALYDGYKKYLTNYFQQIVDILILEGKKTLGDQVKGETLTFSSFIYTDNYFLTPLDIWILVEKYEIPTAFISSKFLMHANYDNRCHIAYGNKRDDFCFIIVPGLRPENVPSYKIIETEKGDVFIPLREINDDTCSQSIEKAFEEKMDIENYLKTFKKPTLTQYKKKQPKFIIEGDDDSDEEEKPKPKPKKKPKVIIEDTSPVENIALEMPKKTRKQKVVTIKGKKTRKNVKQPKFIVESTSDA